MADRLTRPSLTTRLLTDQILTASDLVSLLGVRRNDADIAFIENALLDRAVMGEKQLTALAADIADLPALTDVAAGARADLPAPVAEANQALVIDLPGPRPVVAVVTDETPRLEAIAAALGTSDLAWHITSATHFARLYKATYTDPSAASKPVPDDIAELMDAAIATGGSDIHLQVGRPPAIRTRGSIEFLDYRPLEAHWLEEQVTDLTTAEKMSFYHTERSVDFAYSFGDRRFRVNFSHDRLGPRFVARLLPRDIPEMSALGLPQAVQDFTHLERGLVLVTGPTGSGKSTTLAAILNNIVTHQARHLLTLEDPIEFLLSQRGLGQVTQRELGRDMPDFPKAMKDALRQDPDIILLGEMRDATTIATALEAAETGHLVFGTLHTMSAATTIDRVVSTFPSEEQSHIRGVLANILRGVVSQTLLPTADGKGRIAAHEVLVVSDDISNLIRNPGKGKGAMENQMLAGSARGNKLMDAALADLAAAGKVAESEARFRARDLESYDTFLEHARHGGRR